uniref:7TM GPCR serpentine receptor class x (Srx) domain-containing protein n=1 Tax=Plectus sambesii TaxID=2011161 RepID=A0A914WDZ2_9BILA
MLICDTVQLSNVLFYIAPASVAQDVLYPGLEHVFGFSTIMNWYVYWSMLNLSSVNRLAQICYPNLLWLFPRRNVIVACIIVWPLCALLATTSSFILPCCDYSYVAIGDTFNYTKWGVDLPTNIICSSTAVFCYSMIVRCVHQHRKKIADSLSEKDLQRRIKQEYGFAQQFIAISFAFALTWLLFIFYPKILPENEPKWCQHRQVLLPLPWMTVSGSQNQVRTMWLEVLEHD